MSESEKRKKNDYNSVGSSISHIDAIQSGQIDRELERKRERGRGGKELLYVIE